MNELTLPAVHLGAPTQLGALTIFPVWTDQPIPGRPTRATLPRTATITELAEGPSISELLLANPSTSTFVLFEGMLLKGGCSCSTSDASSRGVGTGRLISNSTPDGHPSASSARCADLGAIDRRPPHQWVPTEQTKLTSGAG
jgi:hypothetical protein